MFEKQFRRDDHFRDLRWVVWRFFFMEPEACVGISDRFSTPSIRFPEAACSSSMRIFAVSTSMGVSEGIELSAAIETIQGQKGKKGQAKGYGGEK